MLFECVRALWRRRRLTMLAMVAVLCVGFASFAVVKPTYESKAQVLFVPSVREPGIKGPTNPFLALGGSVAIVASVVQAQVSDDATATKLARSGNKATYEVTPNLLENAGPVLLLDAKDTSARSTRSTLSAVIEAIKTNLSALQDNQGVRDEYRVTAVVLTTSVKPEVVRKTQVKIAIVSVVVSLALLIGAILLVERRRILASARKRAAGQSRRRRPEPRPVDPGRRRTEERPEGRPLADDPPSAAPPRRATARTRS